MMSFDVVEWTDFASDDWQKAMQKHLGAGSKRCLETLASWQKAANAAAVDASYQPPTETVHIAKAAFATSALTATPPETGGLIELLFDSFSHAALAGIRSAAMSIRQMLYRAEPDQIDIQLEAQPERNRLLVTGQLLDVSHPEVVGREVQVTLSDGRESVVNTMTNQFGEFRGEVENSGDLELSFLGLSGKPIVILLRRALG
ncbi:MAG: hypothetical protein DMG36_17355 [Acidobacteria bacterium]|nr:MAG: hypothetical protein DMG36_17355 [Acidobacteriota bacterium]